MKKVIEKVFSVLGLTIKSSTGFSFLMSAMTDTEKGWAIIAIAQTVKALEAVRAAMEKALDPSYVYESEHGTITACTRANKVLDDAAIFATLIDAGIDPLKYAKFSAPKGKDAESLRVLAFAAEHTTEKPATQYWRVTLGEKIDIQF